MLAFDSDGAGRKAALRSADIALSLDMDVKIADLPSKTKDPADLILEDPELWRTALKNARHVIDFELDNIRHDREEKKITDRNLPQVIATKVLPLIARLKTKMKQAYYVKMIRDMMPGLYDNETILWEELKKEEIKRADADKQIAQQAGQAGQAASHQARQSGHKDDTVSAPVRMSHLDLITRKLFGLLTYLSREKKYDTKDAEASIQRIAGEERYNNLIKDIEPVRNELALEAEIYFSPQASPEADTTYIRNILDELLLNFEENIIREDFTRAMTKLATFERSADTTNQLRAEEMMKECQELGARLNEITKRKK